jgi:septal ring factor EnvC (AmiA/AmiB activator)
LLEEDKKEQGMTEKERDATIQCLIKVMGHQLNSMQDQVKEIEHDQKKNQRELEDFEQEIKKHEEQRKLNDLKVELQKLKHTAGAYPVSTRERDPDDPDAYLDEENILDELQNDDKPLDVMELIADNQVMLNRV